MDPVVCAAIGGRYEATHPASQALPRFEAEAKTSALNPYGFRNGRAGIHPQPTQGAIIVSSYLTYGDVAQADSVALDPIYDLAAKRDLPVSIHCDVSSVWRRDPIYLHEIEHAVAKHPKTRIGRCHAGVSRRIVVPTLTREIRRMLTAYPNL